MGTQLWMGLPHTPAPVLPGPDVYAMDIRHGTQMQML